MNQMTWLYLYLLRHDRGGLDTFGFVHCKSMSYRKRQFSEKEIKNHSQSNEDSFIIDPQIDEAKYKNNENLYFTPGTGQVIQRWL